LKSLEKPMKTIEGKGHLNRKDVREFEKKTNFLTRYLWHKDRKNLLVNIFFPKKLEHYKNPTS